MPRLARYLLLSLILAFTNFYPAGAIINGTIATGSAYVVTLLPGNGPSASGFCTGAYILERVVVTAAHCVVAPLGNSGDWRFPLNELYVSQAGVDWTTTSAFNSRVKVSKIVVGEGFFYRFDPENGHFESEINDIAFLFLDRKLDSEPVSRIANKVELSHIREGDVALYNLGYGCLFNNGVITIQNDGKPYRVDGITGTQVTPSHGSDPKKYLQVEYPYGTSLCPGDSGSPLLFQSGSDTVYVGEVESGRGWEAISDEDFSSSAIAGVNVMWPYESFFQAQWKLFLSEEAATQEAELIIINEQVIAARDAVLALESTHILLIPKPKPAVIKKVTITCIKGKLIKKITAVKPICPAGYKKKP